MKSTDLQKLNGLKINDRLSKSGTPDRFSSGASALPDRRARRKAEQAQGLVAFAVKLDHELVSALRARAEASGGDLGAVVDQLLRKGLAAD